MVVIDSEAATSPLIVLADVRILLALGLVCVGTAVVGAFVGVFVGSRPWGPRGALAGAVAGLALVAAAQGIFPSASATIREAVGGGEPTATTSPSGLSSSSSQSSSQSDMPAQSSTPVVTAWQLANPSVSVGDSLGVNYQVQGLEASDKIVLQRGEGTSGIFQTVADLQPSTDQATVEAPPMGRWKLRIAVIRDGKVVATSSGKLEKTFGRVPLNAILPAGSVTHGSTSAGPRVFRYVFQGGNCDLLCYTDLNSVLTVAHSSCESFHLYALVDPGSDGGSASITIKQDAADPIVRRPMNRQITLIAGTLRGQAFSLQYRGSSNGALVYLNGSFECFTRNGRA
jgi:hypothetical protein